MTGRRTRVRRDDWSVIGDRDGKALRWVCSLNGNTILLPPGLHPMEATDDDVIDDEGAASVPAAAVTAADRIAAMFAGARAQDGARVRLEKFGKDGSVGWCADFTPDEWERGDLPMVRDKFGPGRYSFTLFDAGTRKVRESATLEILALADATAAAAPAAGSQVEVLFVRLMERIDRLEARPPPVVPDPRAQLQDSLALILQVKEVLQPAQAPIDPAQQVANLVTTITAARELAKEVNPAPEPEDPLSRLGPKVLDVISQAIEAQKGQSARPTAQPGKLTHVQLPPTLNHAPAAAVNGAAAPPAIIIEGADDMTDPEKALREGLKVLNGMARMQLPAEQGAELVYANVEADALALLDAPGWFDELVARDANCAQFRPWFEALRTQLFAWRDEDLKEAAEEVAKRARAAA